MLAWIFRMFISSSLALLGLINFYGYVVVDVASK